MKSVSEQVQDAKVLAEEKVKAPLSAPLAPEIRHPTLVYEDHLWTPEEAAEVLKRSHGRNIRPVPERCFRAWGALNKAGLLGVPEGSEVPPPQAPIVIDKHGFLVDGYGRLTAITLGRKACRLFTVYGEDPKWAYCHNAGKAMSVTDVMRVGKRRVRNGTHRYCYVKYAAEFVLGYPPWIAMPQAWDMWAEEFAPEVEWAVDHVIRHKEIKATPIGGILMLCRRVYGDKIDVLVSGLVTGADLPAKSASLFLYRYLERERQLGIEIKKRVKSAAKGGSLKVNAEVLEKDPADRVAEVVAYLVERHVEGDQVKVMARDELLAATIDKLREELLKDPGVKRLAALWKPKIAGV
jgi:hypothetical protein